MKNLIVLLFVGLTGMSCLEVVAAQEILVALQQAPSEIIVGEGKDTRVLRQKKVEGRESLNHCPGLVAPFSEDMALLVVKNYAEIPTADFLGGFNFAVVDGREIFGLPLETYASRREAAWMREGVRRAGRPGMAIMHYPISTRAAPLIAPIDPDFGLRRTDGIMLTVLPDVKIEQNVLTAAMVYDNYGSWIMNNTDGIMGGFCGGASGAIIEAIAKTIAGWIAYRAALAITSIYDMRGAGSRKMEIGPEKFWADSVVFQALNTHTNTICFGDLGGKSGPGTETHLMEVGINAIRRAVNGGSLLVPRQHRARINASETPLESEFTAQVASATIKAGITREEVNRVIARLAETIDGREVEDGPDDIRKCYDLVHHRPKPEYEEIYCKVKKEFTEAGIPV